MEKILLILFVLIQKISFSGIIVTHPVAGEASTANATSYAMANSFTPTAQSLLVTFVYANGTNDATTTITNTGTTLTWTREVTQVVGTNEMVIFWAKVPATVSSSQITFNCAADAGTGCFITVFQFTGYNYLLANPIKQKKLSTGGTVSTNANITFDAALSTNNGYAIQWCGNAAAGASTPPTGWAEGDDLGILTPTASVANAYKGEYESTVGPYTFTNASFTWIVMGVEVYANSAGFFMGF